MALNFKAPFKKKRHEKQPVVGEGTVYSTIKCCDKEITSQDITNPASMFMELKNTKRWEFFPKVSIKKKPSQFIVLDFKFPQLQEKIFHNH